MNQSLAMFLVVALAHCGSRPAASSIPTARVEAPSTTAAATAQPAPVTTAPAVPTQAARPVTREVAILAGGCFWGMQELLRTIPGVLETEVGYTGGTVPNPTYETLHAGDSGHAEAVRIVFDPSRLTYATLLSDWFFRMHDPTTRNRQGNDQGSQYRSAIFFTTPEQRRVAEEVRARMDRSGRFASPIVTEVTAASTFTRAEDYHQDYLQRNPGGYTCHYLREWH